MESKDAIQIELRDLTLSFTGWEKKNKEPKSKKLHTDDFFTTEKKKIIKVEDLYENNIFKGKESTWSETSNHSC